MSAIPLADASGLARIARRTNVLRLGLVAIALVAAVTAVFVARSPDTSVLVPLSSRGDTIVVVDLSASISTETYAQIGATLSSLARSQGRLGLILFSDLAYEALPQGTPARDLAPLVRLFKLPAQTQQGFAATLPPNPWTAAFSGGTKLSAGLTLAHSLAVSPGRSPSSVVLVSDLSDDPNDVPRLGSILLALRRDRVPVRIVGLSPAPADLALFQRALAPAPKVELAPPTATATSRARAGFPWLLVACALVAAAAVAVLEAWAPRLDWGRA